MAAQFSCFEIEKPRQFESFCRSHREELDFAAELGGFWVTEFAGNYTAINGKAFRGDHKGMDKMGIWVSSANRYQANFLS